MTMVDTSRARFVSMIVPELITLFFCPYSFHENHLVTPWKKGHIEILYYAHYVYLFFIHRHPTRYTEASTWISIRNRIPNAHTRANMYPNICTQFLCCSTQSHF